MIDLPEGYTWETTRRRQAQAQARFLGAEWDLSVYDRYGRLAFEVAKQYDMHLYKPLYAARMLHGKWQQFESLDTLVKVMCTKHRIGVRHD